MPETQKCAHPACECLIEKGAPWGKYCSEHCKHKGDSIELRCDCQHPACRLPIGDAQRRASGSAQRV